MQTNVAPTLDLIDSHSTANVDRSPRVWMFWAGIVASCLGALVILSAAAGLSVFDSVWSAGLFLVSPLFGLVWVLDLSGVGIAYESWRGLAIETTVGGMLCLVGAGLLTAHHLRALRADCVTK